MANKTDSVEYTLQYLLLLLYKLKEQRGNKNIGRTLVQKLMYLLNRKRVIDLNYTLYHYGPFSNDLSILLDEAISNGMVNETWKEGKGYHLIPSPNLKSSKKIKEKVLNEIVELYGNYSAGDISVLATAYYLKDEYKVKAKDLAVMVNNVKPKYSKEYIQNIISNISDLNN